MADTADQPFLMPIDDIFTISGRGTLVTGRIETGVLRIADHLEIVGLRATQTTACSGVEKREAIGDEGRAGESVGVLLRGIQRENIERGQVLAAVGTISAYTGFDAQIRLLTPAEGGRSTPIVNRYRPQFLFRNLDTTGEFELPAGVESIKPGDTGTARITLINSVAMAPGLEFKINEGGKTIGTGTVTAVIK
ncbi:EF-Tu/IF-2/RF-3 family GTPase [Streptomyces sp. NPDC091268]|uniref:EF-Tu C-terminal domain-related protein n=1 Tax=Streptomyces sp. NPDC091268 TaxID=3365979 RepID=UPI003812FF14